MPKFLVTASVDATVNYSKVIEADSATEADEIAKQEWAADSLSWMNTGTYELDNVDFDNIEPQEVADDFTLEPDEDLTAELLAALKAVKARINGVWDEPALVAYGPLGNTTDDVLAIVTAAITKAERRNS